ncbi:MULTISPECIES: dTDP-4-dehydrorhamnose 3,5-epimerase family protein [Acinetobacter]|uniref:dTDP-4-dehydrorhamnose 3,5-epimerase n=1 Tax=Acinetobacter corruptisaponis TaxID=3045147 RepID=A0ABY8S7J2_9GAMM|nr:dTDP-4-dehydrorhamnose 3,5-epimerase family protein [Acinetobacter sp. KCTC 92772]WHP07667.1 dTDP-4-dehydrorhamnose 3,5-epimerase family protein [Acinetobacter sp. KCTC 92772]
MRLYKTTNYYNKESEQSIVWNDPELGIDWKTVELSLKQLLISDKNLQAQSLNNLLI